MLLKCHSSAATEVSGEHHPASPGHSAWNATAANHSHPILTATQTNETAVGIHRLPVPHEIHVFSVEPTRLQDQSTTIMYSFTSGLQPGRSPMCDPRTPSNGCGPFCTTPLHDVKFFYDQSAI